MTFSDSRVSNYLQQHFISHWQSVCPVRTVVFDLGEGRSFEGTISGEIALYFCDSNGHVFDILPALQSPAATFAAIKNAHAFYNKHNGKLDYKKVAHYHKQRMKKAASERFDILVKNNKQVFKEIEEIKAEQIYPVSRKGEALREAYINAATDDASAYLRIASRGKIAARRSPKLHITSEAMTVVEPGGRGYYQWQIARLFNNKVPSEADLKKIYPQLQKEELKAGNQNMDPFLKGMLSHLNQLHDKESGLRFNRIPTTSNYSWGEYLKAPEQWKRMLFVHVFKQQLKGGRVKYNSESLEAISIIE